jgi:hypothetical protein
LIIDSHDWTAAPAARRSHAEGSHSGTRAAALTAVAGAEALARQQRVRLICSEQLIVSTRDLAPYSQARLSSAAVKFAVSFTLLIAISLLLAWAIG